MHQRVQKLTPLPSLTPVILSRQLGSRIWSMIAQFTLQFDQSEILSVEVGSNIAQNHLYNI